jgi:hypothetical protein
VCTVVLSDVEAFVKVAENYKNALRCPKHDSIDEVKVCMCMECDR